MTLNSDRFSVLGKIQRGGGVGGGFLFFEGESLQKYGGSGLVAFGWFRPRSPPREIKERNGDGERKTSRSSGVGVRGWDSLYLRRAFSLAQPVWLRVVGGFKG